MKKIAVALAALASLLATFATAEARPASARESGMNWESGLFGSSEARTSRRSREARTTRTSRNARSSRRSRGSEGGLASLTGGHNAGPRPAKWCGWWMRTQLGGGAHLNVAWNWRHYGSPASPQVGAVVVWRHHVGMIVGQAGNGRWLVKSGNWSHRVATVARSLGGAVVRI